MGMTTGTTMTAKIMDMAPATAMRVAMRMATRMDWEAIITMRRWTSAYASPLARC
jgi:hypothetical protein